MQRFLNRSLLARGLALFALLLAVCGTYGLAFINDETARDTGVLLLLCAIPVLWVSIALTGQGMPPLQPVSVDDPPRRFYHWMALVGGIVALLLFAEISANVFDLRPTLLRSENLQFALFFFGSLALAWGLSGGFRLRIGGRARTAWNDFSREEWIEVGAVVAITLLALLLRVSNLERAIPGFVDEVSFTRDIPTFEIVEDEVYLAQPINSVAAFPRLYVYFQWLSTEVFGYDLNGFRLPSALFGAFTAPALYFLCKHLFRRRDIALIAALLMAALPVHIQFSRLGMNNPGDPFFGVLGFAFLARGARYGGRTNYALAGLMLGFAQYFHEAGRLAFPVLAILWLIWLFIQRRDRVFVRNALVTVVCLVIIGLPIYYTFRAVNYSFATRIEDVGLRSDYWQERTDAGEIIEGVSLRTGAALTRLFHRPELILYYAGDTPYIHYMLTPFIVLGFAWTLWRFWQPQRTLLILWAILPFAGIVILLAEIMSPRTTVFQPALVVFAALGVFHSLHNILHRNPRLLRGALVLLVAGLCAGQVVYYFSYHLPRFTEQMYTLQPWQQFIFPTRLLPRDSQIRIVSDPRTDQVYLWEVVRFMTRRDNLDLDTYTPPDITSELLQSLPRELPQAFIVQMPNTSVDRQLRETFPDLIGPLIDTEGEVISRWFVIYIVPPISGAG